MTSPDGKFRYNSPPNWPTPPTGWTPVDGWQPDPAWPSAPEAWEFWLPVETKASRNVLLDPIRKRKTFAEIREDQEAKRAAKQGQSACRNASLTEAEEPTGNDLNTSPTLAFDESTKPEGWRERRHHAQAAKQEAAAEAQVAQLRQQVLAERASIQDQLEFITNWPASASSSGGVVLKKDEHPVGKMSGVGLLEVKRQQGHFVAGSSGVSVRVAKGVRLRAGATRGHMVPGDEVETQIDSGSAVITNQRVLFTGSRQTREWKFDNLLGRRLVGNKRMAWVELPVSNRQKMSALCFPKDMADQIISTLELALVLHSGEQEALAVELRRQFAKLND